MISIFGALCSTFLPLNSLIGLEEQSFPFILWSQKALDYWSKDVRFCLKKNLCLHIKKPITLLNWAEMVFFSSDDLPLKAQFRSWPFDPIGQICNEHYKERKKIVNFKEIFLKNFCLKIRKGLLFFKSDPNSARRVQLNSWIAETKEGMSAQITLGSDHLLSIINEELEGSN